MLIDLDDIYRRLATSRTHQELADDYRSALRQGERLPGPAIELARPIAPLAMAIPPAATVNTAIHTLHALPKDVEGDLPEQLLEIAQRNVIEALGCCQRALELDGADHGYHAEEWLPTVYDIAASLLQSARPDNEPPTLVQLSQEAISWLSRAIAELGKDSDEAPTSLAETLARLLAVWTFTDAALRHRPPAEMHRLIAVRPVREFPQHRDESVDRDHEHTVLAPLHSRRTRHAQNRKRPATAPRPPAATEPPSLLEHTAQLALVVGSGRRGRPEARWR